jgi:hypothetical protein
MLENTEFPPDPAGFDVKLVRPAPPDPTVTVCVVPVDKTIAPVLNPPSFCDTRLGYRSTAF